MTYEASIDSNFFSDTYLTIQSLNDFYKAFKNKSINLSRVISHFGFGLLIFLYQSITYYLSKKILI